MKRLTFKKPFNGMDSALKLIPESYKVDGNEFQITDGAETYNIRWDINEATVLRAENKNLINEDMNKIKHLMGFKSQETLGNLKGEERINENSSFTDVWNKTKSLLSETKEEVNEMVSGSANGLGFTGEGNLEGNAPIAEMEATEEENTEEVVSEAGQAFGMGFTNEGNLEENEPIAEMEKEVDEGSLASKVASLADEPSRDDEEKLDELTLPDAVDFATGFPFAMLPFIATALGVSVAVAKHHLKNVKSGKEAMEKIEYLKNLDKGDDMPNQELDEFEHKDVEKLFTTMGDMNKLQTLASKINTRPEKIEASIAYVKAIVGDDDVLQKKVARILMNDKSEEEEDASPELAQQANDGNMNEEPDRFDEIFEDMYQEELSPAQEKHLDKDGDGEITKKDFDIINKEKEEKEDK